MKAIYYNEHGTADVLQYGDLPIPEPGDDQVLVQVAATSVNPIDRRLRNGELQEYITRTFPVVPGWDFSGRIAKVGKNVTQWNVGDDIVGLAFTWSIQHGTYAEYVPIDATSIAKKPDNLSFIDASALPLVSLTAWQSLVEFGELKSGQTVLIQAGAGGLGSVAIGMAKHLGATVYTTAREANFDYVKSLGADHVIDYTQTNYVDVLNQAEPDGLDLVLESLLGENIAENAIRLAKTGGTVVYMNNEPPQMSDIEDRNIKTEFLHHRADGDMLEQMMTMFSNGTLQVPRIEVRELSDAKDAHHKSEAGHTQGKVVLNVQELS